MKISRKNILAITGTLAWMCLVATCNLFTGGTSSNRSDSWTYDGSQVQYELPNDVRTLDISAHEPVDIFMVKMNHSGKILPAISTRYIVSATSSRAGQDSGSMYSIRSGLGENSVSGESPLGMDGLENVSGVSASGIVRKDYAPARDFVPPQLGGGFGGASRSAMGAGYAVATEPMKSVKSISPTVGSTRKELWVDTTNGKYTKQSATLRAVGTNCYIWVLDSYFASASPGSGNSISSSEAQSLATKFDNMYPLIRNVFGQESDKMIGASGQLVSITSASDTGTKVNIVVYDIEGDYKANQTSGTLGYFWAKDYYTAAAAGGDATLKLTNQGKYFYVDSGFLNSAPNMLYSTLAHEFQHMIDFGQKTMRSMETARSDSQILVSSTWSNEMMSMICEDMVQSYLGIADEDSPIGRLPAFAQGYYVSGLTDWLSGNYVSFSYAGAYAFGAYLARNYGGTTLINRIATNGYVDKEAITQALRATGRNETFDSVFKKYAQALVLDNPPSRANAPSFNKSVPGISGNMKAINIFNSKLTTKTGESSSLRPVLMGTDFNSRVDLRPYGFTLHAVGYTESAGKVRLTFSSSLNGNEKIYILVQPHK